MGLSNSNDPMKAIQYLMIAVGSILILFINDQFSSHPPKMRPRTETSKNSDTKKKSVASLYKKAVKKDTVGQKVKIPLIVEIKENTDSAYFEKLLVDYENSTSINNNRRTDVTIRYYKKSLDQDRVYILRKYGFYIHERPTDLEYDHFPTNAIYYGDSVNRKDLMMIAYALIKQGFSIQEISLSKYHDNWKEHSIEIGTDSTAIGQPTMTLSEIRKIWRTK